MRLRSKQSIAVHWDVLRKSLMLDWYGTTFKPSLAVSQNARSQLWPRSFINETANNPTEICAQCWDHIHIFSQCAKTIDLQNELFFYYKVHLYVFVDIGENDVISYFRLATILNAKRFATKVKHLRSYLFVVVISNDQMNAYRTRHSCGRSSLLF